MDGKSTAQTADTQFASLRITIPMAVVRQLKIMEGDKLNWKFAFEAGQIHVKRKKTTKEVRQKRNE